MRGSKKLAPHKFSWRMRSFWENHQNFKREKGGEKDFQMGERSIDRCEQRVQTSPKKTLGYGPKHRLPNVSHGPLVALCRSREIHQTEVTFKLTHRL